MTDNPNEQNNSVKHKLLHIANAANPTALQQPTSLQFDELQHNTILRKYPLSSQIDVQKCTPSTFHYFGCQCTQASARSNFQHIIRMMQLIYLYLMDNQSIAILPLICRTKPVQLLCSCSSAITNNGQLWWIVNPKLKTKAKAQSTQDQWLVPTELLLKRALYHWR
jgi:hypothetical protein